MSLGEAAVDIVADTDQLEGDISSGLSGALKVAGAAAVAVAAAAGAAVAASFTTSVENEVETDRVAASLGLSPQESRQQAEIAGDVYAEAWGESMTEVQGVVGNVMRVMRGASEEATQGMVEDVMTVSDVFGTDYERTIQAAQELVTNGLAPDFEAAMDTVAAGLRDTKGPADDVLDTFIEYSGHFAQIGLEGPAALQAVSGEWATNQYAIDKAGDAIKEFGIRVIDGSDATKGALGDLGFNIRDVEAAYAEGGPAAKAMTEEIITAITSIEDPAARAQAGVALMGTPFEDLGKNAVPILDDIVGATGNVGDATGAMADTAYDNVSTLWTSVVRTLSQVFTDEVGGEMLPVVTKVLTWVKETLPGAITGAMDTLKGLWGAFQEGDGVIDGLLNVFGELTGPGGVGSIFQKVQGIVKDVFGQIVNWLATGGITQILNTLVQARTNLLNAAMTLFPAILDAAISFLPQLLTWLGAILIPNLLEFIVGAVPQLLETAITLFNSLIDAVVQILPMLISTLLGTVLPQLLTTLLGMVPQILEAALDMFTTLLDAIVDILPKLLQLLLGTVLPNVLTTLLGMIPQLLETAITVFTSLITAILDVLPDLITTLLVDVLPGVLTTLIEMIPELLETAITVFTSLVEALVDVLPEILTTLAVEIIPAIVGGVNELGPKLFEAGKNVIRDLWDGIKEIAGQVVQWVEDNVVEKIQRLWPFSPAKEGPFAGTGSPLHAGRNIARMLGEGLADATPGVISAAEDLTRAAAAALGELEPTVQAVPVVAPMAVPAAAAGGQRGGTSIVNQVEVKLTMYGDISDRRADEIGTKVGAAALEQLSRARVVR